MVPSHRRYPQPHTGFSGKPVPRVRFIGWSFCLLLFQLCCLILCTRISRRHSSQSTMTWFRDYKWRKSDDFFPTADQLTLSGGFSSNSIYRQYTQTCRHYCTYAGSCWSILNGENKLVMRKMMFCKFIIKEMVLWFACCLNHANQIVMTFISIKEGQKRQTCESIVLVSNCDFDSESIDVLLYICLSVILTSFESIRFRM